MEGGEHSRRRITRRAQAALKRYGKSALLELFSPPRVTAEAERRGLAHSGAIDLRDGHDLTKPSGQDYAIQKLVTDEPWLTALSPSCRAFSPAMVCNWNKMDPMYREAVESSGLKQLGFSALVAHHQHPIPRA